MDLSFFHAAVAQWFIQTFGQATEAQKLAWPAIQAKRHTLVAAPTGSGKTLAAFLAAIDEMVQHAAQSPGSALPDEVFIVYISPLKALSNDIHVNLDIPIEGIRAQLAKLGLPDLEIRSSVRTGDTPTAERQMFRKRPPHILVTTPESLYVLLGSASGRRALSTARTVIVDEIHALVGSKRGSHLALSLQRLDVLCGRPVTRIGLSATQKPIIEVAKFLVGSLAIDKMGVPDCKIIDIGYNKKRDLALEIGPIPLQAVMSNEQWDWVYTRIAELSDTHRTILVFVNTRRMAERAARNLGEKLGQSVVMAHHGSMARELRLDAEQRLKRGELRILVATASLELGIDIGHVDLVCQLGSPRSIAAFLQRVGRARHEVGGVPKGRLFPQSRDDLVECSALLDCIRRGELDALVMPIAPIDVLAQQIVAEVASQEWDELALYEVMRQAWPYAQLSIEDYQAVVRMLAEGFTTRRGTRAAYLHRDVVHGQLRGRQGSRLTALMSGGTIPDTADYAVVLEPQAHIVGSVHEDFAVESMAGDIFQLGNTSYRITRIEPGKVSVVDAQGLPPSIPFWLGEAPGRTDELSFGVSRLRAEFESRTELSADKTLAWLIEEIGLDTQAAEVLFEYLTQMKIAFGMLPTQENIAIERFFDESGGTQLLIHAPFGSRINRAWGLALRKRFCRKFNFELQAAATEDVIVLSLSTSHSFPLDDIVHYLHSNTAREVLIQALLDAPLFPVRWRWNATTALALPRFSGGKKTAPQLQRMRSEDLLATVFPDQVACAENLVGEREIPDHPLVAQTLHDCLNEAMDVRAWLALLQKIEGKQTRVVARDLTAPSPFAAEALSARPYAFLDDAPLEERRTQAVSTRRYASIADVTDLGRLDVAAIDAVRAEAWPCPRDVDEMHEALMGLGCIGELHLRANEHWRVWLLALAQAGRATLVTLLNNSMIAAEKSPTLWFATERLPWAQCLFVSITYQPKVRVPDECMSHQWSADDAARELVRSQLSGLGPTTVSHLQQCLFLPLDLLNAALFALEHEGYVMRGRFSPNAKEEEWCERHLLARIHRYTLNQLRREIEPVTARDFIRFLCEWQSLTPSARMQGPQALHAVLAQLEGYPIAAEVLEQHILPARVEGYSKSALDELCATGRFTWMRLRHAKSLATLVLRTVPVVVLPRINAVHWLSLQPDSIPMNLFSSRAQSVAEVLTLRGALFFDELLQLTRLLRTELEDALAELVANGCVHSDRFSGLRELMPAARRRKVSQRHRRAVHQSIDDAGRWTLVRKVTSENINADSVQAIEHIACVLLRRYGVVFWRLLQREADHLPSWRDLLRVYHRLEARGEIRGGRFVTGFSGEQFALPEAVSALRRARSSQVDGGMIKVSSADPLNLLGYLFEGEKLPRQANSFLILCGGIPIATSIKGSVQYLTQITSEQSDQIKALLRRH